MTPLAPPLLFVSSEYLFLILDVSITTDDGSSVFSEEESSSSDGKSTCTTSSITGIDEIRVPKSSERKRKKLTKTRSKTAPKTKKMKCSMCAATLTPKSLENHVLAHIIYRRFHCSHCSYKAITRNEIKKHNFLRHKVKKEDFEFKFDQKKETELQNMMQNIYNRNIKHQQCTRILGDKLPSEDDLPGR
jgi:hypothetical protein